MVYVVKISNVSGKFQVTLRDVLIEWDLLISSAEFSGLCLDLRVGSSKST